MLKIKLNQANNRHFYMKATICCTTYLNVYVDHGNIFQLIFKRETFRDIWINFLQLFGDTTNCTWKQTIIYQSKG